MVGFGCGVLILLHVSLVELNKPKTIQGKRKLGWKQNKQTRENVVSRERVECAHLRIRQSPWCGTRGARCVRPLCFQPNRYGATAALGPSRCERAPLRPVVAAVWPPGLAAKWPRECIAIGLLMLDSLRRPASTKINIFDAISPPDADAAAWSNPSPLLGSGVKMDQVKENTGALQSSHSDTAKRLVINSQLYALSLHQRQWSSLIKSKLRRFKQNS